MRSKKLVRLASIASKHGVSVATAASVAEISNLARHIVGGGGRGKVRYLPEEKAQRLSEALTRKQNLRKKRQNSADTNDAPVQTTKKVNVQPSMTFQQMADYLNKDGLAKTSYKDIYRIYSRISDELKDVGLATSDAGHVLLAKEAAGTFVRHIGKIRRRPSRARPKVVPVAPISPVLNNTVQELKNQLPQGQSDIMPTNNTNGDGMTVPMKMPVGTQMATVCQNMGAGLRVLADALSEMGKNMQIAFEAIQSLKTS